MTDTPDPSSKAYNRRKGERNSRVDTGGQTVDEIVAAVDAGTVTAQQALDAERQGKNRSTLISQLESRGAT